MSPAAQFALARQLRSAEGTPLGEVFSFVSGLYFRGKLAYARRFAKPPDPEDPVAASGVLVITPNAGLRAADTPVTLESLQAFASVSIDLANASYRRPLERTVHVRPRELGFAVGLQRVCAPAVIRRGVQLEVLRLDPLDRRAHALDVLVRARGFPRGIGAVTRAGHEVERAVDALRILLGAQRGLAGLVPVPAPQ